MDLADFDGATPIPDGTLRLAKELGYQTFASAIITMRWIETDKTIEIFASGDTSDLQKFVSADAAGSSFVIRAATYSLAQLTAARETLFANSPVLPSGQRLIGAAPLVDGSGLKISVESAAVGSRMSDGTIARTLSELAALPVLVGTDEIPVNASRYNDSAPYVGGAYLSNNVGRSCTSGFTIGTLNAPNPQILSADHCTPATGASWWSGNVQDVPHFLGSGQGQAPGGSDLERIEGTNNALAAYVYVGATTANTTTPIRGWTNPIVGASVCYSGAPSGTVCNNTITQTNEYICYLNDPGAPCYDFLVRTVQQSGIPAAGNGDSGGPVIQAGGGGAYATGIISGISGGGDNCTGRAATDTRKCSATVIYAPISNFLYNNPNYGIYTVLPSGA